MPSCRRSEKINQNLIFGNLNKSVESATVLPEYSQTLTLDDNLL